MSILDAIILGMIQGITEFIPVSSSGHLVLAQRFLGLSHNFTFDVLLNFGTLLALLIFFRARLLLMVKDAFEHKKWHILGLLFIATIPAVCIGFVFGDTISRFGQSVWIVVIALIVVGALMIVYGNERKEKVITADEKISKKQALTIGIAQAIALIPGVSRSGITILSGLRLGFSTKLAADFSFLLAIPIIFGASMRVLLSDEGLAFVQEDFGLFLVGNIASFLFGALAISTLLKYLRNHGLAIFGWYRIGLALVLSALLLTGVI